jgi:hypothetical protein
MSVNVNEAVSKIKSVGRNNVRSVPMSGQDVHNGSYQIEIKENNTWVSIAECPNKKIADEIIIQATNKVILG